MTWRCCAFLRIFMHLIFVRRNRINLTELKMIFSVLVKRLPVIHVYDTRKMEFFLRSSRTTLHLRMIIDNNCFSFVPTYSCRRSYTLMSDAIHDYEQTIRKITAERDFCIAVVPQLGLPLAHQVR